MGILILFGIVGAVAFLANGQEESPALWGLLTFILCIVGNLLGGLLGLFLGGGATFMLMQLKISRFG